MPESSEDLSVIVPTFNHSKYIENCLNSILRQKTQYKIYIYIMDDLSTDGTGEICDRFAKQYPDQIQLSVSPYNLGSGKKAHYFHAPQIRGKYWAILEGDDWWISEDKVEKQISAMESDSRIIASAHAVEVFNEIDKSTKIDSPTLGRYTFFEQFRNRKKTYHYSHTSTIIWRNIFGKRGMYLPPEFANDQNNGDPILFALMTRKGGDILYLPNLLSRYNLTGVGLDSRIDQNVREKAFVNIEDQIRRLLPLRQRLKLFFLEKKEERERKRE